MRYKENFKKGMVRLIISTGISHKQLSEMIQIPTGTLSLWDAEYRREVIDEKLQEEKKSERAAGRGAKKNKMVPGRYE